MHAARLTDDYLSVEAEYNRILVALSERPHPCSNSDNTTF